MMNQSRYVMSCTALLAVLVFARAVISGQSAPSVPFPQGYRSWQHVKSIVVGPEHRSFARRGGFHHYYANAKAAEGYETGTFANGSIIVDEGVTTKNGEGDAAGILLEGARRSLDVMVKDDRLYKDTGGWGFEHFDGDDPAGKLGVEQRTQCFQCHSKSKDRDLVFSVIRP
jgi:hypothetical protein